MIKTSKNKILRDVVILLYLLVRKIKKNLNLNMFCKKVLWKSKTAITFAYNVGKNRIVYQNVQHEMLYMLVVVACMLEFILTWLSLLQKCMLLLTAENYCNLPICRFYIFLCDFLLSIMSTCFMSIIMPPFLWWGPCILIWPIVRASCLWSGLLVVNVLSMLNLSYHVAMFAWCYQLIHA